MSIKRFNNSALLVLILGIILLNGCTRGGSESQRLQVVGGDLPETSLTDSTNTPFPNVQSFFSLYRYNAQGKLDVVIDGITVQGNKYVAKQYQFDYFPYDIQVEKQIDNNSDLSIESAQLVYGIGAAISVEFVAADGEANFSASSFGVGLSQHSSNARVSIDVFGISNPKINALSTINNSVTVETQLATAQLALSQIMALIGQAGTTTTSQKLGILHDSVFADVNSCSVRLMTKEEELVQTYFNNVNAGFRATKESDKQKFYSSAYGCLSSEFQKRRQDNFQNLHFPADYYKTYTSQKSELQIIGLTRLTQGTTMSGDVTKVIVIQRERAELIWNRNYDLFNPKTDFTLKNYPTSEVIKANIISALQMNFSDSDTKNYKFHGNDLDLKGLVDNLFLNRAIGPKCINEIGDGYNLTRAPGSSQSDNAAYVFDILCFDVKRVGGVCVIDRVSSLGLGAIK